MNERMRARAAHEIHCVVLNARLHAGSRNFRTAMKNRLRIGKRPDVDLIEAFRIEAVVPTRHDFALVLLARVTQQYFQLETIELGLRQWICSFVFDWVLSGKNRKDRRQLVTI